MGLPKEKHQLHIELTAEQYQRLCQQAKLCGLCKRAYIVRLIDGTPIRARPSQEIKNLRTEIHHIGNNHPQTGHPPGSYIHHPVLVPHTFVPPAYG